MRSPPSPTAADLHIGRLLRRGLAVWRRLLLPVSLLAGLVNAVSRGVRDTLVMPALDGLMETILSNASPGSQLPWLVVFLRWEEVLVSLVIGGVLTSGAVSAAGRRILRGNPTSTVQVLRGLPRTLVETLPTALLAGVLVGIAGVLLLPGLYLATRVFVAGPARGLEGPGALNALVRSSVLSRGHRTWILALVLLLLAAEVAVRLAVGWGLGIAGAPAAIHRVAVFLDQVVILGLGSCLAVIVHHDLRRAREGVGVEELETVFG